MLFLQIFKIILLCVDIFCLFRYTLSSHFVVLWILIVSCVFIFLKVSFVSAFSLFAEG